jgi:hypothetical protein
MDDKDVMAALAAAEAPRDEQLAERAIYRAGIGSWLVIAGMLALWIEMMARPRHPIAIVAALAVGVAAMVLFVRHYWRERAELVRIARFGARMRLRFTYEGRGNKGRSRYRVELPDGTQTVIAVRDKALPAVLPAYVLADTAALLIILPSGDYVAPAVPRRLPEARVHLRTGCPSGPTSSHADVKSRIHTG